MTWNGIVVSRFDRIANVQHSSGRIYTICTSDYAPAATRFRVRAHDWRRLDPSVGENVSIEAKRVYVGYRSSDLIRDPDIRVRALTTGVHEGWTVLLQTLWPEADVPTRSTHNSMQIADVMLTQLARVLPEPEAVRGLIGLGQGMTPSGDDILVGYMAVEHLLGIANTTGSVCSIVRNEAWQRTTDFSASMLEAASDGFVAADLLSLLDSLGARPTEPAQKAFDSYIHETGHFSGRDTVFGIACGIRNAHHHSISGRQTA